MDLFSFGYLQSLPKFEIISPVAAKTSGKSATLIDITREPQQKQKIQNPIELEIKQVFGKYADKAFKLLECENRSLDPFAVNYNEGSTDYGIFQINDYWQGIRHKGKAEQFLFDTSINIRIAWRIFEDDGYSFKLWTCGRKLGI